MKHIYSIASGLGVNFALIFKSYYINLRPKTNNTNTPVEREFIVMPFCCKFIEIDWTCIPFLGIVVMKLYCHLKLYYKYISPIGRKLFNYGSFLKDLDIIKIRDIVNAECSCFTSPFCILLMATLLQVILTSFLTWWHREPSYMAPGNIELILNEYVENFVTKMSRKYKDTTNCYKEWSAKVKEIISKSP